MEASNRVFVLDKKGKPLMPCIRGRAWELIHKGRAVVHKHQPFTIRLKDRVGGNVQPVRLGIDPGSRTTGLALARETPAEEGNEGPRRHALWLGELEHRGGLIRKHLEQRRNYRKRRRGANLRYRPARFKNRKRAKGWLPPSLWHRVDSTRSWVQRLRKLVPIAAISVERVRFDTQAMRNPSISGMEYQQGTLASYEQKEYLLEKWGRKCVYCGKEGVPLQKEHILARIRGGTKRSDNLLISCGPCNQKKGSKPIEVFLKNKPELLKKILDWVKKPLPDAAMMNATRNALYDVLVATGLPVEAASGGRTKYNRIRLELPKTHAIDALCVGNVSAVLGWQRAGLGIKATGRGVYQRTFTDAHGFKRGVRSRKKTHYVFRTGDHVHAVMPKGKYKGTHTGRVAVRETGWFTMTGIKNGQPFKAEVFHAYCRRLERADGYDYTMLEPSAGSLLPALKDGVSAASPTGRSN